MEEEKNNDVYAKNWNLKTFLIYLFPSMLSMLILSLYTIVDGLFLAKFVWPDALAWMNIAFPFMNLGFWISIMAATWWSAIVWILLGKWRKKEANEKFTLTILMTLALSFILGILGIIFADNIVSFMGATPKLFPYAKAYLVVLCFFFPLFLTKIPIEFMMRIDGVPQKAFNIMVITGIINVILDYFFIKTMNMWISWAALWTGIAWAVWGLIWFFYFFKQSINLRFILPKMDLKFFKESTINGSSELVNMLSTGVTTLIFNIIILKMIWEWGVSALTALFLLNFLMASLLIRIAVGFSPLISYYHWAKNNIEKTKITNLSFKIMVSLSITTFFIFFLWRDFLASIFSETNNWCGLILVNAIKLFSLAYLFTGINLFVGNYFTALNEWKKSAIISLSRTLVWVIIGLLVLPYIFWDNGIWLAVPFAETITVIISIFLFVNYNKKVSSS